MNAHEVASKILEEGWCENEVRWTMGRDEAVAKLATLIQPALESRDKTIERLREALAESLSIINLDSRMDDFYEDCKSEDLCGRELCNAIGCVYRKLEICSALLKETAP